jgi:hypothetical protein
MRNAFARTIAAATGVVLLVVGATTMPAVRAVASGWWNDPAKLAALPDAPQVHYEAGAADRARAVATLLPTAIARVEAMQGRPFAHPVTVGVYASRDVFAAANGTGFAGAVGVTFLGNVVLSPVLFTTKRQRLPAILTHELSHAHLRSWMSELTYIRLPNWFKEGLAVTASGGGGAEGVSEAQARDAIRRGDRIRIASAGSLFANSLFEFIAIRFERPPEVPDTPLRFEMAYRQSGMFVAYLRDANPDSFARMMEAILDGRPFAEAVTAAYGTDLQVLWLRFLQVEEDAKEELSP